MLSSCSSNDLAKNVANSNTNSAKPNPPPPALADVHAVGVFYWLSGFMYGGYWKNATQFGYGYNPNQNVESIFNKVYLNGADVYIAGQTFNGQVNVATIYKNGVITNQYNSTLGNTFYSTNANDMVIASTNTIVVGSDQSRAIIWNNAIPTILKNTTSRAVGIARYNNMNYVIGDDLVSGSNLTASVTPTTKSYLWINGQETLLSTFGMLYTTNIKIYNDILYIAGGTLVNGVFTPIYITKNLATNSNFVVTTIPVTINTFVNSLLLVNSDLYLCGSANSKAVYWKNGTMTILNSTINGFCADIANFGTDIYIGGGLSNGNAKAAIWKNGVYRNYNGTLPGSSITSIAIQ